MPKNPGREGSPRLITPQQIEQEYGIRRSTLYTYRHRPTFPQPVKVEGSIKTFYRADEVAAWVAANPKQQGKRTDLAATQGAPAVIEGQMGTKPLNGNDARAILGIVWQWIEGANDGTGSDVGDLTDALESAGYGPVAEAQDG
ncbi:AlpA family phage regulatory protein [Streptomyces sp. NPDC004610]|uniref:helix-turn-helix transcriptional regulator n=1 Tax=unclassified Streptomyces TaxID=2593676 RepID=UPI0033B9549F